MNWLKSCVLLALPVLVCACDDDGLIEVAVDPPPAQSTSGGNLCEGFSLFTYLRECINLFWVGAAAGTDASSSEMTIAGEDFALSGTAFVSPEDSSCCPADAGVSVTWSNDTMGEFGTAVSSVTAVGGGHHQDWDHRWEARIPLRPGPNRVTVIAADRSGNWAKRSITVRRESSQSR